MKKSIAIICEYILFPERIGGMDRFFKAYDEKLKENGYKPTWFFKNVNEFDFFIDLNIKSANNTDIEKFFLHYCLTNSIQFDVVVTHFLQPVSRFFKEIKKTQKSYIINVDHNPRPLEDFPIIKRIKNRIKGLLYGKYIDKLIGVSDYTKRHILQDFGKHLNNKTSVIYNGIDVFDYEKQQLDRSSTPMHFIVVSHLRKSKGIQDLLKAIYLLDNNLYEKFKIDIYGDGSYKKNLIDLCEEYQLNDIVNFKGSSPNLDSLFHQYHYMIQPTYMECFSLSILESLGSNVPVITTTVGGNTEIIEDGTNGFIFEPKDIDKLVEIIQNLVTNKMSISNKVNSVIENEYTLEIMVQNHLKYLPY